MTFYDHIVIEELEKQVWVRRRLQAILTAHESRLRLPTRGRVRENNWAPLLVSRGATGICTVHDWVLRSPVRNTSLVDFSASTDTGHGCCSCILLYRVRSPQVTIQSASRMPCGSGGAVCCCGGAADNARADIVNAILQCKPCIGPACCFCYHHSCCGYHPKT